MSFKLSLSDKDRTAGRFKSRVNRELVSHLKEALSNLGMTEKDLATATGINEEEISKILSGQGNLTLQLIGELSWAAKLKPVMQFYYSDSDSSKKMSENYIDYSNSIFSCISNKQIGPDFSSKNMLTASDNNYLIALAVTHISPPENNNENVYAIKNSTTTLSPQCKNIPFSNLITEKNNLPEMNTNQDLLFISTTTHPPKISTSEINCNLTSLPIKIFSQNASSRLQ